MGQVTAADVLLALGPPLDLAGPLHLVTRRAFGSLGPALPLPAVETQGELVQQFAGDDGDTIDIRPMETKGQGVVSEHQVTLKRFESVYTPAGWDVAVYRQDMPKAMWGAPLGDPRDVLDGDGLLSGCLAGITFEIPKPELAPSVGWVGAEALEADGLPDAPIPLLGSQPEGPPSVPDDEGEGSIGAIVDPDTGIAAQTTATRRASVHAALAGLGFAPRHRRPPDPLRGPREDHVHQRAHDHHSREVNRR